MIEGYVVKEEGSKVKGEEVKERMRERLPEYMVPWRVVVVEKIPINGEREGRSKGIGERRRRKREREGRKREESGRGWRKK